jgi:hypothetical protein
VKGVETSNPDEEEVEKTFCSPDWLISVSRSNYWYSNI